VFTTRAAVAALVVGVCLFGVVGGVAVVDADEHDTDNVTQHERPEEIGDDGNLSAAQDWLNGRMAEIHLDCAQDAEELSVSESTACSRLDEEYPEYLEQYASVEREQTGSTETADTFNETRDEQQEFAEKAYEFNETSREYQEARDAGDEQRARELARELLNRSQRIDDLGDSLNRRYVELENRTGADYGPARNSTNRTVQAVENITQQVALETFTPTTITAEVTPATASFSEPATISGRLPDENGTVLAGRTVVFVTGNQTFTIDTDANGTFEATYRPITTTTGPTTVSTIYEPALSEDYLGSRTDVEVDVVAIEPSLSIRTDADRLAFGDSLSVQAEVSAAARSVPSVPVALYLGDERIATGRTGDDGSVSLSGTVPATVANGDRELTVRASRDGTALSPAVERRPVTVERTETDLTVDGSVTDDELVVTGRLTTADGRPIAGQSVGVNVDGEIREVTATDSAGRYELRVPRSTGGDGEWSVAADFENPDSNLGPSTASRTVRTEGPDNAVDDVREAADSAIDNVREAASENRILAAAVAALIGSILAVLAVWYYVRHRKDDDGVPTVPPAGADEATAPEPGSAAPETTGDAAPDEISVNAILATARQRLGDGSPSDAVRVGYGAVRDSLLEHPGLEGTETRTHRELYRDVRSTLPQRRAAPLKTLTDAYEQAVFAPTGIDEPTADAALEAADECLTARPATDDGTAGDRR